MKLRPLILTFLGSISCHAFTQPTPATLLQDLFDYHYIEDTTLPIDETPPPPSSSLIDLDTMTQSFVLETKKIEIPDHPFANNPSIIRWKGKLLMSFRTYNPETRSTSPFGLVWLSDDFEPIGPPQIFELPYYNSLVASKQQDPRLIDVGGRLFIVYNNQAEYITDRELRRMFYIEMDFDGTTFTASEPECILTYEGESDRRFEKNWAPFTYNNQLYLTYSIIPHKIFHPLRGTNSCETVCSTGHSFKWDWGAPRGGTQALRDGDHYIGFFHSWTDMRTVQSNDKKISHYVMGAYTFEAKPPFSLIAVSPTPIVAKGFYDPPYYKTWKPLRCVFPAGILVDKDYIWVTYGRQDHEAWVIKMDKKQLLQSLVPVSKD